MTKRICPPILIAIMVGILIVLGIGSAAAAEPKDAPDTDNALGRPQQLPHTLTLALEATVQSAEVTQAQARYDTTRAQAAAAGYRGDLAFSVRPSWETSWEEAGFTDDTDELYHEIRSRFETRIPTGLSHPDQTRLEQALSRAKAAEAELRDVLLQTASELHHAYADAYLAGAELKVLEEEEQAVRARLVAKEARYRTGEGSLIEIMEARDQLRDAEQDVEDGVMRAELALLELHLLTGTPLPPDLRPGELLESTPTLVSPLKDPFRIREPRLDTALDRVAEDHPVVAKQLTSLAIAQAEESVPRDPFLSSVELGYSSKDGHGGAVAYSFRDPSLTLSYTTPAYEIGEPPPSGGGSSGTGRDDSDETTVSLSAVFSLSIGRERANLEEAARAAAQVEDLKLQAVKHSVASSIRSRAQAVESARARLALAKHALERAEVSLSAALAQDALGTARRGELEAAEAAVARARFSVLEAEVAVRNAQFRYVASAHMPEALPHTLHDTLFQHAIEGGTR